MDDVALVLKALEFAAGRHRKQHRKGADKTPYINHPIQVANLLANEAGEKEPVLIAAAILHDVIEDTVDTPEGKQKLINQISKIFGKEVLALTLEVTDDKSLEKHERKDLQVFNAPSLSVRAKKLRIADKIMNLRDITDNPPEGWPLQRIIEYLKWSERVVTGVRGINSRLDSLFDKSLDAARLKYS
ncbi:MAG: HD domain-containing protein [Bacteroidales bacterium]